MADAELIVVCTPVEPFVDHVAAGQPCVPGGALITDAGSTKAEICRSLAGRLAGRGVFVGRHPMAGSEKSGPEFADPNLFEGWLTVVTPTGDVAEKTSCGRERSGSRLAPACDPDAARRT